MSEGEALGDDYLRTAEPSDYLSRAALPHSSLGGRSPLEPWNVGFFIGLGAFSPQHPILTFQGLQVGLYFF